MIEIILVILQALLGLALCVLAVLLIGLSKTRPTGEGTISRDGRIEALDGASDDRMRMATRD